jgi:hypothetical protein
MHPWRFEYFIALDTAGQHGWITGIAMAMVIQSRAAKTMLDYPTSSVRRYIFAD